MYNAIEVNIMPKTLSPLRYPGGKTKLFNYTKKIIENNNLKGCTYIEAFAGGCGLALELLKSDIVDKIILNDIDISIYSLWQTILENPNELIDMIINTDISINEWNIQKSIQKNKDNNVDSLKLAFSTLFLNRTNFSGILNAAPIGGYEQQGKYKIDCRFNKEDIIQKIKYIYSLRDRISFYNLDAENFIDSVIKLEQNPVFCFFDPPYFKKGQSLYVNFYESEDHFNLSRKITSLDCNWIVTYDNVDYIKSLYSDYFIDLFEINYSAANHVLGKEIMIYSDNTSPFTKR